MNIKPKNITHLIQEVSEFNDCGMVCHINADTMEVYAIPKSLLDECYSDDVEEFKNRMSDLYDLKDVKFPDWENSIVIEPLPSFEAYKMMESFVEQLLDDDDIKEKLIDALNRNHPFSNFKHLIEMSPNRQDWFSYKKAYILREVKEEIEFLLKEQ